MNNQSNHNNFDDRNESILPEEIKFNDDGSEYMPPRRPRRGGNPSVNRALYVTAVVLLLSVAIIAAVTSAANRSRKNPVETPTESSSIVTPSPSATPTIPESTPESLPPAESSGSTEDVSGKLPTFVLPVSGSLGVGHDPEIQVFSPTMQEYRVHLGIDINTTEGAPVYAAAKGKVSKIWNDPMMGWCIEITHSGGAETHYKNLSETLATGIKEGAEVKSGQLIGCVGDSAMMEVAQEPHLHFELKVNGKQENPLDYFATDVLAQLESDKGYEG